MSFILDALKKSENERQRQLGPSLADIPLRRARTDRPWWAFAVAALLIINLGVLGVVLLRDRNPEPAPLAQPQTMAQPVSQPNPQTTPTMATTPQQQPAYPAQLNPQVPAQTQPAPANPVQTDPSVLSLAEAAGEPLDTMYDELAYDRSIASAGRVPEGPPIVRQIEPASAAPSGQATFDAVNRSGNVAAPAEALPTHSNLIARGTHLPDMRLDIHVYSPNPQERFVFVNMRKYVEGQATSEGPLLERITAEGAVLNQNGTRFLLPRQ